MLGRHRASRCAHTACADSLTYLVRETYPRWCYCPADEAMGDDVSLQPLQLMHPQVQNLQQAEQALGSPLSPGGVKPMSIDPPFIVAAQQDDVQTADAGLQLAESMSIDSSHAAVQWLQQSQLGATAAPSFGGTMQVQCTQAVVTKVAEGLKAALL